MATYRYQSKNQHNNVQLLTEVSSPTNMLSNSFSLLISSFTPPSLWQMPAHLEFGSFSFPSVKREFLLPVINKCFLVGKSLGLYL